MNPWSSQDNFPMCSANRMIWGPSRRLMHELLLICHFLCSVFSLFMFGFIRFTTRFQGLFEQTTIVLKGVCVIAMLPFILRSICTKPIFKLQEHIIQKVTYGLLYGFHSIRNMQYRPLCVRHLSQLVIQNIKISVMLEWRLEMTRLLKQLLVAL